MVTIRNQRMEEVKVPVMTGLMVLRSVKMSMVETHRSYVGPRECGHGLRDLMTIMTVVSCMLFVGGGEGNVAYVLICTRGVCA